MVREASVDGGTRGDTSPYYDHMGKRGLAW